MSLKIKANLHFIEFNVVQSLGKQVKDHPANASRKTILANKEMECKSQ
jgi:hypothetical protein